MCLRETPRKHQWGSRVRAQEVQQTTEPMPHWPPSCVGPCIQMDRTFQGPQPQTDGFHCCQSHPPVINDDFVRGGGARTTPRHLRACHWGQHHEETFQSGPDTTRVEAVHHHHVPHPTPRQGHLCVRTWRHPCELGLGGVFGCVWPLSRFLDGISPVQPKPSHLLLIHQICSPILNRDAVPLLEVFHPLLIKTSVLPDVSTVWVLAIGNETLASVLTLRDSFLLSLGTPQCPRTPTTMGYLAPLWVS